MDGRRTIIVGILFVILITTYILLKNHEIVFAAKAMGLLIILNNGNEHGMDS